MARSLASLTVRPRAVGIGMLVIVVVVAVVVFAALIQRPEHPGTVELAPPSDTVVSFAGVFPAEDAEAMANPLGIAFDGEYLYVAESDAGVIRVFDTEGGVVGTIVIPIAEGQRSAYPSNIAVAGERLAVVDNAASRVIMLNREPADPAAITVTLGDDDTPLLQPTAVTYAEGQILVADAGDRTIKVYSPEGTHLQTLDLTELPGESAFTALAVKGTVIRAIGASSGHVYALDIATGEIVGDGFGQFPMPRTLEPVGDGALAIADGLDRSVLLADTDGREIAVINDGTVPDVSLSSPRGVAWVKDLERLYVTDAGSGRVFIFNVRLDLL